LFGAALGELHCLSVFITQSQDSGWSALLAMGHLEVKHLRGKIMRR